MNVGCSLEVDDEVGSFDICRRQTCSSTMHAVNVDDGREDDEEVDRVLAVNKRGVASNKKTRNPKVYWSAEEDTALISGWCNYTLDNIRGTNQTKGTVWGNVTTYVREKCPKINPPREENSCRNRWG